MSDIEKELRRRVAALAEELATFIQRAYAPKAVPRLRALTSMPYKVARERVVDQLEEEYFTKLAALHNYNSVAVAEAAELHPTYVRKLLHKYRLTMPRPVRAALEQKSGRKTPRKR